MSIFLILLIQMVSPAAAGAPGHVLPSAHPAAKGSGEVALNLDTLAPLYWGPTAIGLSVESAPTDRLLISGSTAVARFPFPSVDSGFFLGTASARYDLTSGDAFNVAPFIGMLLGPYPFSAVGTAGVALEGGWDRVRLDASLGGAVLVGLGRWTPVSEAGLTWRISKADSLRIGTAVVGMYPLPSLAYRHTWNRVFLGAHAGFTPLPGVGISGGVQW